MAASPFLEIGARVIGPRGLPFTVHQYYPNTDEYLACPYGERDMPLVIPAAAITQRCSRNRWRTLCARTNVRALRAVLRGAA